MPDRAGVVVGEPAPVEAVCVDAVPFLARDLAGLAADAQRGVGEESRCSPCDSSVPSCVLTIALQQSIQLLQRSLALAARPGHEIAHQRLGFHDAHVGLLGDGEQIVGDVAGDHAL